MIVIGITGPTGAGKTTALNELEKLGGSIIDCDAVYHDLLESDNALQTNLRNRFGAIDNENGGIDRKKLGAIVFQDPAALEDLNRIVHAAITGAVQGLIRQFGEENCPAAAIDAIALFESGLSDLCDTTLAITAPAEVRVKRIMAREGIPEDYARSRVSAQNPEEFYTSRCAHTLVNDCASREDFALRAHELLTGILEP